MKVAHDEDPFFGLIQALMHATHLATTHQVARLGTVRLRHGFSQPPELPFDLYLMLEAFDPSQGKYRPHLYERARELGQDLVVAGGLSSWVGRVACIEVVVPSATRVDFSMMWQAV